MYRPVFVPSHFFLAFLSLLFIVTVSWGTWGCGVSKFPWTYDQKESCYLLSGKVTVTPADGRKAVTFGKGDFVSFVRVLGVPFASPDHCAVLHSAFAA
jgi:EutQ-like cupin domain